MKDFFELREAYRKPTAAEIAADKAKDSKGKDTSDRYRNIKKKVYGNAMGGLKKEESVELDEAKLSDMGIHNKIADRNLLIKAIKTAEKMGGNMTGAVREIEKMKKGLSKHKAVQAALRQANESVELGESVDFMKMSKELLKHKDKGIEYEKAAAYVRAIHNNSNVNVQDKAFMGLTKMLKDMDDFTKRTTITKILKDNGFRVRGGKLMRESAEENLDEISTSLLKRARDKASKNTVDARKSASRNTKKYLKDPESGHGIKALKDLDKADKSRRQKKHFDKALKKRSAKESVELEEAKTVKVSRADFDKLKKGSVIDVDWDGAMSAGAAALKVVSKSRSAKYDVEKIKLMPTNGGRSAPFYLYSRKGGDATLAIGDMGASMTKYKIVKESVELEEAAAKVKTTMPDKVASGAQRFGLKATTKGGHVSISGSKGKLNDFMRAIIGRSSYGNASDVTESVDPIVENYRTLAKHGMGAETKNSINVGRGVDYYQADGAKYMGKITKITKTGYVVKDEKDGKSRSFAFYDRAKAKELLAK